MPSGPSGTVAGVSAALAGYFFTYFNSRIQEERRARIGRVSEQLRDLYGPLLAAVMTTKTAYDAMVRHHSPNGTRQAFIDAVQSNADGPEARAFRLWMDEVLQPLNERAATIITEHIDLLESNKVEPHLLQLVAHVTSARVMQRRWRDGDLQCFSVISYPDKLVEWVQREFGELKKRQAQLLGTAKSSSVRSKL